MAKMLRMHQRPEHSCFLGSDLFTCCKQGTQALVHEGFLREQADGMEPLLGTYFFQGWKINMCGQIPTPNCFKRISSHPMTPIGP